MRRNCMASWRISLDVAFVLLCELATNGRNCSQQRKDEADHHAFRRHAWQAPGGERGKDPRSHWDVYTSRR